MKRKLKTLKPRVQTLNTQRVPTLQSRSRRMTGRKLQVRRLDIWKDDPYCKGCGELTRYPGGFELDHIVPLYQGGADSVDNLQVLCKDCHTIKTGQDLGNQIEKAARFPDWIQKASCHLTIVFGAPGSGKSSYVRGRAKSYDLVIDLDEIESRLSGLPIYQAEGWLEAALRVRNKILASLSQETRDAWFIVTGSKVEHRQWWIDRLAPSNVVVMDTPKEVCIERVLQDSRRPQHVKERNIRGINDWFKPDQSE